MFYTVFGSDGLLRMTRNVNTTWGAENIRYFSGSGSVRIVDRKLANYKSDLIGQKRGFQLCRTWRMV
jgi:hypothetical protein